jgi:O-antigen/teichoic acid export membrane protein
MAARDQMEDLRRVTITAIRYTLAMAAPVCIFVSVFAESILRVWLGDKLNADEFRTSAGIVPIFLIPLLFALGGSPAQSVYTARARIGAPTMVSVAMALLNLVLCVVLFKYAGWGLYGIAAGTGITVAANAILFTPYYLCRLIDLPFRRLAVEGLVKALLLAALYALGCWVVRQWFVPQSLASLVGVMAGTGLLYAAGAWALVLEPRDRQSMQRLLPWRRTRRDDGPA